MRDNVAVKCRQSRRDGEEEEVAGMSRQQALVERPFAAAIPDKPLQIAHRVLRSLFGPPEQRSFAVRFWNGDFEGPAVAAPPKFTLILKRPGALRRMLLPPTELAIGEGYLRDDFDVDGDFSEAAAVADQLAGRLRSPLVLAPIIPPLLALPTDDLDSAPATQRDREGTGTPHTRQRDAAMVRYHYDAGNNFYALWLDRRMVYSCAYFKTGTEDIDAAQTAKLEHICRKLRLAPGESLLDVGCGWGGLLLFASEHYGVRATGITLSEAQAALARERIAAAGLSDRCRVEVCDYRDLPQAASFDKAVSVGMVEHVGKTQLPVYFGQVYRHLRPGGLFLNHGIAIGPVDPMSGPLSWLVRRLWRDGAFIQRYVFPDGELVRPGMVVQLAEQAGFETRDLENLREHYVVTLRHWIKRLEERHHEAVQAADETTYRIWRLYMSTSAHAFRSGSIGIVQALFSRPTANGACRLPLTRADLYAS